MQWRPCPHGSPSTHAGTGVGLITVRQSAPNDPKYRGGWFADAVYPAGRMGPFETRDAAQRAALSASRRALRRALRSLTT